MICAISYRDHIFDGALGIRARYFRQGRCGGAFARMNKSTSDLFILSISHDEGIPASVPEAESECRIRTMSSVLADAAYITYKNTPYTSFIFGIVRERAQVFTMGNFCGLSGKSSMW